MTPRVSIVIPTYNRAGDLRRALVSVIQQTCREWEVLVVDNHSIDNTAEVVRGFGDSRIRMLSVYNNGVIAVSRNLGVRNSTADYVAFLDSDDWWVPSKLERSLLALYSGADIVYHDLYLARSSRRGWRLRRAATRPLSRPIFNSLIECGNVLTNSSVVVRRSLFLEIGGLSEDPEMTSWEDYDCWLRLARVTEKFSRLTPPLGWYWVGGGNVSSPLRTIRNLEKIRRIYFGPEGRNADEQLPAWYHYGMGRACYHLQIYPDAWRHMNYAIRGQLPIGVRTKALITLGGCLVHGSIRAEHVE